MIFGLRAHRHAPILPFSGKKKASANPESTENPETSSTESSTIVPAMDSQMMTGQEHHARLLALEAELMRNGIVVCHRFKVDREILTKIAAHMAPRVGNSVYQVASFTLALPNVSCIHQLFGNPMAEHATPTSNTWAPHTVDMMRSMLAPVFAMYHDIKLYGLSKPLKTASETHCRLIAMLALHVGELNLPSGRSSTTSTRSTR